MKKLTFKERKFIKEVVEHGNQTRAYLNAYETTNRRTASVEGARLVVKPRIRKSIEEHLQEAGYTPTNSIHSLISNEQAGKGVQAKASDSIRASELLLKLAGGLIERKQQVKYDFSSKNIDELLKLKKKYDKLLL